MTDDTSPAEEKKVLWGQDFRVVTEGLAETDVVVFVEKLLGRHRERVQQLDHLSALNELATKTVEDAQALARSIEDEARAKASSESEEVIAEARREAESILEAGRRTAADLVRNAAADVESMKADSRTALRERIQKIDAALKAVEDAAVQELSTRMQSHYIWKYLNQSVHFLPAFRALVDEVEAQLDSEQAPATPPEAPEA